MNPVPVVGYLEKKDPGDESTHFVRLVISHLIGFLWLPVDRGYIICEAG